MEPLLCRTSSLRLAASSLPLPFLAPSLLVARNPSNHAQFSTSTPNLFRKKRHGNKQRGVSGVRRTGLRYPVGMSKFPLPEPQLDPEKRTKITTDENHGLWGFFNKEKKLLTEPLEEAKHGSRHIHYFSRGNSQVLQGARGDQVSCVTSLGKTYMRCGGSVVKRETELLQRPLKEHGSRREVVMPKLEDEIARYEPPPQRGGTRDRKADRMHHRSDRRWRPSRWL